MPFSKSVMGRGIGRVTTTPLGFKVQPSEKTLAEYIERKQDAERKKLTFEEWYSCRFPWGESPMPRSFIEEIWKAAQENCR